MFIMLPNFLIFDNINLQRIMNDLLNIFMLNLLAIMLVSCGSSNNLPADKFHEGATVYPFSEKGADASFLYYNSYILKNSEFNTNDLNRELSITFNDGVKDVLIKLNPETSYVRISKDSVRVYMFSIFKIVKMSEVKSEELSFKVGNKELIVSKIDKITQNDLILIPGFSITNGTNEFSLFALRVKADDSNKMYFPSSEQLRIEIVDSNSSTIWNSNHEKSYMTVVGRVLPENAGEIYKYELQWTGKARNNKKIVSGAFGVHFILPVSPIPYFFNTEIYLD